MVICSGSNIWDNRMSFCSVLSESTVIKFWCQHGNFDILKLMSGYGNVKSVVLKSCSGEQQLCRRSISSASKWTHYLFVFLLFVLTEMYSLSKMKKYLRLGEDEQLGSFKINTTTWVLHSQCKNACVLSHIDHDMFCFLMERMTGAG